jgi:hypothetical protein
MNQHIIETAMDSPAPRASTRLTGWRVATLALVLGLVVSVFAGCVVVPWGYDGGYRYHRHHYGGYYRY